MRVSAPGLRTPGQLNFFRSNQGDLDVVVTTIGTRGNSFQEITGYLPEIEHWIALLMNTSDNQEALGEIHRLFHNIKGAASQVAFAGLSNSAAICEAILADLLESGRSATTAQLEFLRMVNGQIQLFCYLDDKSISEENNLFMSTISSFNRFLETSGQESPITLPDSSRH